MPGRCAEYVSPRRFPEEGYTNSIPQTDADVKLWEGIIKNLPPPDVCSQAENKRTPASGGGSQTVKAPGELERVATLSNFQSRPAACTVGTGRFLRRKISFSRAKIVSLQFLLWKSLRFQQKLVRVAVAGEFASPSTGLSKLFDKPRGQRLALCPLGLHKTNL